MATSTYRIGDSAELLKELEPSSVDLIVTDPPYGYSFMGKDWDRAVPSVDIWRECLRVLKPGAFAFIMSAPRLDVQSEMARRIQEAGFDISFTPLFWAYATGFPKAMNVGKAVDKRLGAEREVVGQKETGRDMPNGKGTLQLTKYTYEQDGKTVFDITAPATPQAKALDGAYAGFQPKPSLEIIMRAQKPLSQIENATVITSQAIRYIDEVTKWLLVPTAESNLFQNTTLRDYFAQRNVQEYIIAEATAQIGRVADHCVPMDISTSISAIRTDDQSTSLNTAWLWKSILVESLGSSSRFTTSTATEQITDLKILNTLLSLSISESTTHASGTNPSGLRLNVGAVESLLRSVLIRSQLQNQASANTLVSSDTCTINQPTFASNAEISLTPIIQNENSVLDNATRRPEVRAVIVAMKPLEEKTYVDQALANGHGVTWLDDCRIPFESEDDQSIAKPWGRVHPERGNYPGWELDSKMVPAPEPNAQGRFPANLLVSDDVLDDGEDHPVSGSAKNGRGASPETCEGCSDRAVAFSGFGKTQGRLVNDSGGFSRYFSLDKWAEQLPFLIVPKASKGEKNKGIANGDRCTHPTVKPLKLMSYLITLGSREGEVVLDPFAGSGTTLLAARMLNRSSIGFELSPEYVEILKARTGWLPPPLESFVEGGGA